jgi:hypothetical protein
VLQRRLTDQISFVRAAYDAELLVARQEQVSYSLLGDEVLVATGKPRTADHLARIEWVLRSATRTATRRRRVKGDHAKSVALRTVQPQHDGMPKHHPIFVRETYFDPNYLPVGVAPAEHDDDELDDPDPADDRDGDLDGNDGDDLDGDEGHDGDDGGR